MNVETGFDSSRDLRALLLLIGAIVLFGGYYWWSQMPASSSGNITVTADDLSLAEQRLARMREIVASVPGKQAILDQVSGELAVEEEGLIRAETANQAQAEMIQILRRLGMEESPGIEVQASQLGRVRELDEFYGVAPVTIRMRCRIEQLINFLAAVADQPQLITMDHLSINSDDAKDKTLRVEAIFSGVIPRDLVPQAEGAGQ